MNFNYILSHVIRFLKKNDSYQNNYPNHKDLNKTEKLFNALYAGTDCSDISRQERKRLGWEEDAFIYGEVKFLPFLAILNKVNLQSGDVFYDLGCGAGKAVFIAALCFDLSKACGVEMLPSLCAFANDRIEKAKSIIKLSDHDCSEEYIKKIACVQFTQGNFLDSDFSGGDVIFITATCYSYPTWEKLVAKLSSLKRGSRVIVVTKKIESEQFQLIDQHEEAMSWGMSSVHIYVKIS